MFPQRAQQKLNQRIQEGTERFLPIVSENYIDFYSNDYLGLAKKLSDFQPQESHAGATGSRLISGNTTFIEETETYLAHFYNAESALLFSSGYTANLALMSCLPQRGDLILYDELIHASLRDGIRLSHAKSFSFKHNQWEELIEKAQKATGDIFVVVEGIYSMDGDTCPLKELIQICNENQWFLILDEAHSTGTLGQNLKGIYEDALPSSSIFARIHTFGKALGTHGAVIVGNPRLRHYLINFARPFIYTTGMPNAQVEIIRHAHELLNKSQEAHKQLEHNILYFKKGVNQRNLCDYFLPSSSPIQGILHEKEILEDISNQLKKENMAVKSIYAPTVPKGKERIRLVLHSYNTPEEIDTLLNIIEKTLHTNS